MRTFEIAVLTTHLERLIDEDEHCKKLGYVTGDEARLYNPNDWNALKKLLQAIQSFALQVSFPTAYANASALNVRYSLLKSPPNISTVAADVRHVKDMLLNDAWNCKFIQIPEALAEYVDNAGPWGEKIFNAFPNARQDFREAGNCLAADCNTAAVFHLMRAVEWGLRALAINLGLLRVTRRKKGAKVKYVPLAYSDWEHILNQLQGKVDKRVEALRPGKVKQEQQEFYYPILQDIRGIRDAWRNHVMHARRQYSAADALAIAGHVKRLMEALASRVSEV
jgi:hypothetical protein